MSVGILTGIAEDRSQIDVVFEVYAAMTGADDTYNLFGGMASVTRNAEGGFALNIAGVQVAGSKQKKPDMRVMTFDNFKRNAAGNWGTHAILGKKPKLEYIGPGLEEISFSILLSAMLGVAPEEELAKLRQMRDEGTTCAFVVGDKPVTNNLVVVQKVDEEHRFFDNKGNLLVALINISLQEYVDDELAEDEGEGEEDGI